jgi:ubiquinone/menaquinone biosynthesis C-methylase UbiE
MTQEKIRFDNGANYQKSMGIWSELVGSSFLDWLALPNNLNWLDDGCGNGDFTELVIKRCLPKRISGIDLSSELLNYARTRPNCQSASFELGDAMNLPYGDNSFDVVVMALVIFFLPDPSKGLSEMVRVVRSGGCVASYTWDLLDALYPLAPVNEQLFAMGYERLLPPNVNASNSNNLHDLWVGANLENIQVKAFTVDKFFDNFEDYWGTVLLAPNINSLFNAMTPNDQRTMLDGVRKRLPVNSNGKIVVTAKANAIRGQVP